MNFNLATGYLNNFSCRYTLRDFAMNLADEVADFHAMRKDCFAFNTKYTTAEEFVSAEESRYENVRRYMAEIFKDRDGSNEEAYRNVAEGFMWYYLEVGAQFDDLLMMWGYDIDMGRCDNIDRSVGSDFYYLPRKLKNAYDKLWAFRHAAVSFGKLVRTGK